MALSRSLSRQERRLREQLNAFTDRLSRDVQPFADVSRIAVEDRFQEARDTSAFMRIYLPHYADAPDAHYHADLDAMLDYGAESGDAHVFAVHGPREHAKSSRARGHLLKRLLYGDVRYWLFGSEHLILSRKHVEATRLEFESNRRLRADFGIEVERWSETEAVLQVRITPRATGVSHVVRCEGISYGTSAKGRLFVSRRPDGALVDDFENTRTSRNSRIAREKLQWVLQELYPAVTGSVLWLGNTGHDSSALYQAGLRVHDEDDDALRAFLKAGTPPGAPIPDWTGQRRSRKLSESPTGPEAEEAEAGPSADLTFYSYRAEYRVLDEQVQALWRELYGAETVARMVAWAEPAEPVLYLWPQRYAPRWYARKRATMGAFYEGEYNGFPVRVGLFFKAEWFPRWEELPEDATWFSWCDPAFGRSKYACYKTLLVGCTDGHAYYVVDAWCRQQDPLSDLIDAWYDFFERYPALLRGSYENNFGQDDRLRPDLVDAERRHGQPLRVRGEANRLNKEVRIDSLQPLASRGAIHFPARMTPDMKTVFNFILEYPDGEYPDPPDALESLVSRLRHVKSRTPVYEGFGGRRFAPGRRR